MDDYWIDGDALQDWYIPVDEFIRLHNDGSIKVLTIDEFKQYIHTMIKKFDDGVDGHIDACVNYVNEKLSTK